MDVLFVNIFYIVLMWFCYDLRALVLFIQTASQFKCVFLSMMFIWPLTSIECILFSFRYEGVLVSLMVTLYQLAINKCSFFFLIIFVTEKVDLRDIMVFFLGLKNPQLGQSHSPPISLAFYINFNCLTQILKIWKKKKK